MAPATPKPASSAVKIYLCIVFMIGAYAIVAKSHYTVNCCGDNHATGYWPYDELFFGFLSCILQGM